MRSPLLLSMEGCLEVNSPQGKEYAVTNRRYYGLSFCRSGKITYTQRKKQRSASADHSVDEEKYVSDPSCAVILPQGSDYRLYGNKSGSFPLINFRCDGDPFGSKITVIPLAHPAEYLSLFDRFLVAGSTGQSFSARMSFLYHIFDLLEREGKRDDSLAAVEEYILSHFSKGEINNAILADICHLSEVGFRKKFCKRYGVPPKRYVMELRLKKAEVLLETTAFSIEAISEECGFSNLYYFYKMFKDKWHCTPKEYRSSRKML